MKNYVLSLDAGTTSSRAILFDQKGNLIAIAQQEFTQIFPKKGWVEHNPNEIWETQVSSVKKVLSMADISPEQIDSIGITNQRETTIIWDRATGIPVFNAIVWQDRRTAKICEGIISQGKSDIFTQKTGLVVDAYFSATKIKWILDQDPELRDRAHDGELAFGTVDSWLIWNLTGGATHVTDATNASRTMIYNIHEHKWDQELLDLLEIPNTLLPNVTNSSEIVGNTDPSILGTSIRIAGIAGDQQAALFGQLCLQPGDVKNTYGTGCFCIMNTGEQAVISKNNMLTTIAWQINNEVTYAIEGSVFTAGALVQWLRDQLQMITTSDDIEALAESVSDNGGVTFVPALAGLGAPYWDPHATGSIMGITRGTNKGHIARAALEAIALRSMDIIIEMQKDAGIDFKSVKVDGGASNNNLLMQIQADFINANVIRPKVTETTALGAAFLAGLATGFWSSVDVLKDLWGEDQFFKPLVSQQTKKTISLWEDRVSRILTKQ
ncbi:MAG: glycerol kinase GlpK [Bacteroidota bacterium]|nr:glycerol kinase GlpK [Bacteroidota bacterium]MEC9195092.1 glycerol kinase GlpK [Bacteroidota bacterium]MEE3085755.1 glycerol kinase GlpK [Bacteroidota bacterium]